MRGIIIWAVVLILFGLLLLINGSQQTRSIKALSVTTDTGAITQLGPTQNKVILINFWASTCTVCLHEIPHLIQLHQQLHSPRFEILGVSMHYDPPIQAARIKQQLNIPYPLVFDLDQSLQTALGLRNGITPTTVVLDTNGRIVEYVQGMPDMKSLRQQILELLSPPN